MQIAVLFDEQSPEHPYYAGHTARQLILQPGILQESGRSIVVRAGTVLLNNGDPALRSERIRQLFFADSWRLFDPVQLTAATRNSEIFAWVLSNVDRATATRLHEAIIGRPTYLGLHAVNFAVPVQLALYRLSLGLLLRIEGRACSQFWRAFEPDARDLSVFDHLQSLGFTSVRWEDVGARETIFDDFDTLDHFARIESLRQLLGTVLSKGADDADDLIVVLEDLSPRLAATLGTAAGSFLRAESEEDLAQVGLSTRRYCEQLADALYPARPELVNGRDVGEGRIKNRLWAYVEEQVGGGDVADSTRVQQLGGSIDRVWLIANNQLHGTPTRERISSLIGDLAVLSATLLALAPALNRKPYTAYSPRVSQLIREWLLRAD